MYSCIRAVGTGASRALSVTNHFERCAAIGLANANKIFYASAHACWRAQLNAVVALSKDLVGTTPADAAAAMTTPRGSFVNANDCRKSYASDGRRKRPAKLVQRHVRTTKPESANAGNYSALSPEPAGRPTEDRGGAISLARKTKNRRLVLVSL